MADKKIIGFICELRAKSVGKVKAGTVTVIEWDTEKALQVSLNADNYAKAIQLHLEGVPVEISIGKSDGRTFRGRSISKWAGPSV